MHDSSSRTARFELLTWHSWWLTPSCMELRSMQAADRAYKPAYAVTVSAASLAWSSGLLGCVDVAACAHMGTACAVQDIHPWDIGGYWALPLQWIQNALAINEFSAGAIASAARVTDAADSACGGTVPAPAAPLRWLICMRMAGSVPVCKQQLSLHSMHDTHVHSLKGGVSTSTPCNSHPASTQPATC